MGKYRRQTQALLQIPASGSNIFHFARIASQCRGPWDHLYTFIKSKDAEHRCFANQSTEELRPGALAELAAFKVMLKQLKFPNHDNCYAAMLCQCDVAVTHCRGGLTVSHGTQPCLYEGANIMCEFNELLQTSLWKSVLDCVLPSTIGAWCDTILFVLFEHAGTFQARICNRLCEYPWKLFALLSDLPTTPSVQRSNTLNTKCQSNRKART
eukprot:94722-Amphidinium_carterae.1